MANRRITRDEAIEILKKGAYGVLSTASPDGTPYGVPMNYVYIEAENAIFFHCFIKGRKLENIRMNSRVSFAVVGRQEVLPDRFITHYESAVVSGTARIIEGDEEKRRWLRALCAGLAPEAVSRREEVIEKYLPAVSIIRMDIEEIRGKRNEDQ
jgi:nitroimidazol reductase NimA-like FMN-containing flavoprotein (pyridoxamine 5'-phosphate oxidase superfamily)